MNRPKVLTVMGDVVMHEVLVGLDDKCHAQPADTSRLVQRKPERYKIPQPTKPAVHALF